MPRNTIFRGSALGVPALHQIEGGSDDAHEVALVDLAEVGLDGAAVLAELGLRHAHSTSPDSTWCTRPSVPLDPQGASVVEPSRDTVEASAPSTQRTW